MNSEVKMGRRPVTLLAITLGCLTLAGTATGQTTGVTPTVAGVVFSPATIPSGATSQLTISFSNANATAATLSTEFTNFLPPGLTVTTGASSTCLGGTANTSGSSTVTYSAGAIPSGGCSITVTVTGATTSSAKYFTDSVGAGALQTSFGANPNSVSATLIVQAAVTVPNTVGLSQAAAQAQLVGAGFAVVIVNAYSDSVPVNLVINTQPAAGTSRPRGATIRIQVSQGPGGPNATTLTSVPGLTQEQQSVAQGLQRACSALATATVNGVVLNGKQQDLFSKCTALIGDYSGATSQSGLGQALTAISGRQATAETRIPMQFAAGQIANIGQRLNAVRGGASGIGLSGLDPGLPGASQTILRGLADMIREHWGLAALGGGAGDEPGGLFSDRLGIFATGTLRRGTQSDTDAESGFDFKNTGITLGADYRLGDSYVLGVATGYGKSTTTFADSGGRLDAKHTSISLYGSWFTERFHLDWMAGYGHATYELGRDIEYGSSTVSVGCDGVSCSVGTTGSTGAREYNFAVTSGYSFNREAWEFGPTLELDYHHVNVKAFTESGPSGLDLDVSGLATSSLVSKFGGMASYALKTRWFVMLPQMSVRYLHEFQNNPRTEAMQFAADTLPGASDRAFAVYTNAPDRNYFEWKASLLFQFPHAIVGFIDYGSLVGLSNISTRELNVGLRLETGLR
ncbi:MAG TPA: autotransporter domain-containing protein [Steroidobacteraceae bacterium]